ncbi:hypothetical protein D1818_19760 [Aquimarina sp. BL5]|uniref:hypothetical protein n=1 Tax=Aquimarina sp. BL5 TaxID=1714860 RepID=UPI000E51BE87|nr:hypothetical protein [Aquimarina sp. BL5]AXT52946.1 hypothetical protein D1818_19760 [Aquimarina sp. BL5]RKN10358.1 hypothetical protein D7036_02565 [Aquimarina sp. BL5]
MKNIFTFVLLLVTIGFYGQDTKRISFLNLVGNHIQVPRGCQAQSEFELQACNGTSIKWDYYSDDMLKDVFYATISAFAEGKSEDERSEVIFTSFGSELKGFKFKFGNTFQYFLQGKIKDQPLMMNLGTPADISANGDLEGILKLVFEKVG